MRNNKQSSVEWLIAEIQRRVSIIQSEPQTMARELMIDNLSVDLEQAKAMHKEEICKSYVYGSAYGIDVSNGLKPDKYYNETFNQ
jgi:hypothetical protein